MNIKLVNFKDGVYLAGQVKQTIGHKLDGNQGAVGVSGVTRVQNIEATGEGLIVTMNDRKFFVPWVSVASCELHPDATAPAVKAVK
jgi:hypothetical protein